MILLYHPDKCGSSDKFLNIKEAYDVLSDNDKKREYDLKLKYNFLEKYNLFDLTNEDYLCIEKIMDSNELKLIKLLYKTLPNFIKENLNKHFNFKEETSACNKIIKANKYIDISKLNQNFTLELLINLCDAYCNKLKIITIKTKYYICYLYIRDFNDILILNGSYNFKINFKTKNFKNMYRKCDDLYYLKNINIFNLYYGIDFFIDMPNNININIKRSTLLNNKTLTIKDMGFNGGDLIIIFNIIYKKIDDKYKNIIYDIFN